MHHVPSGPHRAPAARRALPWLALLALPLLANPLAAHVVVHPREARAGAYETFTVRCPNERGQPTVQVELEIPPDAVAIHHHEPKPGWKTTLAKNSDGDATRVVWTAEGAGLQPDEFVEFRLMGKIRAEAKDITWKARQTYGGNEVVDWSGEPGSKTPASVTRLTAGPAATGAGDHGAAAPPAPDASPAAPSFKLAVVALVFSLIALATSVLRGKAH